MPQGINKQLGCVDNLAIKLIQHPQVGNKKIHFDSNSHQTTVMGDVNKTCANMYSENIN